ncbi:MAG: aromatic aminobenezylarsenical efflux permease ArsG family transporter [Thermodesulfobacteriota bacterium]|nr:MAG: aromatic aminobenezylarsenical efflux permease ArsG family transporter [Thermodesulfobacteriota bacterium]
MGALAIGLTSALWLGILTSVSPCPLATNIAATSYLSKNVVHPNAVLRSGIAYTLGRMVAYALLGFIIVKALLGVAVIAQFLQDYLNKLLGPILIIAGLVLLDVIKINITGFVLSPENQQKLAQRGDITGSFALGLLFALSFCPISAGLFFGSLIPLSLQNQYGAILPIIYGLGTGLPVLLFSVCLALGAQSVTKWFHRVGHLEYYARKITGGIFIVAGLFYLWTYVISGILLNL